MVQCDNDMGQLQKLGFELWINMPFLDPSFLHRDILPVSSDPSLLGYF
jgi:hypothetical protein